MPYASVSNGTAFPLSAAGPGFSETVTVAAGKTIYVIVQGTWHDLFDVETESCTIAGVTLKPLHRGGYNFGVNDRSIYIFSGNFAGYELPTGAQTLQFTSTLIHSQWTGGAFNVLNGPADGCIVLPAGYQVTGSTTLRRKVLGWDASGLVVAFTGNASGCAIAEGNLIVDGDRCYATYVQATDTEVEFTASRPTAGAITLFAFMIPHSSQTRSGGGFQPWFTGLTDLGGLAVGDTVHAGLPWGGKTSVSDKGRQGNCILMPGTLRSMAIRSSVAPGVGNEVTLEIMRGGTSDSSGACGFAHPIPTGITLTLSGTDTEASLDGINLSWARYERIGVRYTNTGSGSVPAGLTVTCGFLVEAGVDNEQVYGGGPMELGAGGVDVAVGRGILHPDAGTSWAGFPDSQKSLVGIAGTVTELVVNYQLDTAIDPDHDFYLALNGVLQDGTGGTVDTKATYVANGLGQAMARARFALAVVPGDLLAVIGYERAGSSALRHAATIKFSPTTPGEMMLSGHTTVTGGGAAFVAMPSAEREESSTVVAGEFKYSVIVPPMTAAGDAFHRKGLRVLLETAGPGSGKSWSIASRNNLADSASIPALVLADATTTDNTGGDDALVGGDNMSLYWTPAGNPASTRQFFTIPGVITPPEDQPPDDEGGGGGGGSDSGLPTCVNAPVLGACLLGPITPTISLMNPDVQP